MLDDTKIGTTLYSEDKLLLMYLEIHLLRNILNIKDDNFEVNNAYYIASISPMLITILLSLNFLQI